MDEKTPEQLSAEAAAAEAKAAEKAAAKAAEKERKAKEAAERKATREAAAAERKAKNEAEAAAAKVKREADKAAKAEAVAAAKAAREANRMPEQNGVRRPKPEGLCGKVWTLADSLSQSLGQPVPVANLIEAGVKNGLNEGNIKAEYARWRKFNGVTGRITLPKPAEEPAGQAATA